MKINNDFPEEDDTNPVDSFHLSYAGIAKVGGSVSMATDKKATSNSQHVDNEVPKLCGKGKGKQIEGDDSTSSKHRSNNVYNTQISYDKNQAIDLES